MSAAEGPLCAADAGNRTYWFPPRKRGIREIVGGVLYHLALALVMVTGRVQSAKNTSSSSEICWDKFDTVYRNQCTTGNWEQRFYFDHASLTCRPFWYDGCRSPSRNMFDDALTCQWLCEAQPMYKSKSCLEEFDHHYKEMCNGGRWRQQFYFDRQNKQCVPFWYDGCTGTSQNLFPDELTCLKTCEDPANRDRVPSSPSSSSPLSSPIPAYLHPAYQRQLAELQQRLGMKPSGSKELGPAPRQDPRTEWKGGGAEGERRSTGHGRQRSPSTTTPSTANNFWSTHATKPWHSNDKAKMREKLGEVFRPNGTNICETANPCQNNATCIFAWKKNTFYCKCKPGWTGSHCTEVIAFDPCAPLPCKNGATCKAKHDKGKKPTFECYCATGYGGPNCDQRPCDSEPCQNNGTCRATAASSTYFCDCPHHFGGKSCEFEVGGAKNMKYGQMVEQISSGKAEWVEEMKVRLSEKKAAEAAPPPKPLSDQQYRDVESKRQDKEKAQQEEEYRKMQEEQAKRDAAEDEARAEEEEKIRMARMQADEEGNKKNYALPSDGISLLSFLIAPALWLF